MKKNLCFLLCILFFCAIPVRAAQPPLTVTGSAAVPGQSTYVTLRFNETIVGDSIAVTYTWDKACLEPLPGSCVWSKDGVLQDFDHAGGVGVWTVSEATDLKGDICVLTFYVPADAKFTQTTVKCTVLVKNNGATVGSYQAETTFGQACDHQYSDWQNANSNQHKQVCSKCNNVIYEEHNWVDGQILDIPNNPNMKLKVLFCTVCKTTKEMEVSTDSIPDAQLPGSHGTPDPGIPDVTQNETQPQNDSHNHDAESDTQNHTVIPNQTGKNPISGTNSQNTPVTDNHGHILPTTESHEGHDHGSTASNTDQIITTCIIIAVASLLVLGALFLVKKKR